MNNSTNYTALAPQMFIEDTRSTVQEATVWIKQKPDGSFAPDESKAAKLLKWFQDGVLKHKDPGM